MFNDFSMLAICFTPKVKDKSFQHLGCDSRYRSKNKEIRSKNRNIYGGVYPTFVDNHGKKTSLSLRDIPPVRRE